MKEEIKHTETSVEYTMERQWKLIVSVVKNILQAKIQALQKVNKTDSCFHQIVLFVARKNKPL